MKSVKYVGLDVHKDSIAVAVYGIEPEPEYEGVIPNTDRAVTKLLKRWKAAEVHSCYEAGPTGFALHRLMRTKQIRCDVIAPGKIPRRPGDRIKTDRRDARMLGKMLRSGDLKSIYIPTEQDEAVRDFLRARDDLRLDVTRNKQRLTKFLLRKGYTWSAKPWSTKFRAWLRGLEFPPMEKMTFDSYSFKILSQEEELLAMDEEIARLSQLEPYSERVALLRCFKGIDTLTAMFLVCEIGDFARFPDAESFMAFLGMVPGEFSSGSARRQLGITKTGNPGLRRLLIEAAWHYRFGNPPGKRLRERRKGRTPAVVQYAERAQSRLNKKFKKLIMRGKPSQIAVTAVGRELAGFIWGAMNGKTA